MKAEEGLPTSASLVSRPGLPAESRWASPDAPPQPRASLIHPLTSILERLEPAKLFPQSLPLEVDLGSGDGTFVAQYAQRHPERNFIAVERLLGRLRKIDRKGLRAGLTNLRPVRIEASYLLEYLLPPESVSALHVYFPDPWPKRKQRKHRLVNARFTELVSRVLTPGGAVYLRTDNQDYFAQMTAVFAANPDFAEAETPDDLIAMMTDFEKEFRDRGIAAFRVAYQRSVKIKRQ
jgi:tRNA (guanine-N7-)-methyltransferase